jgi:WD40 repeat protein
MDARLLVAVWNVADAAHPVKEIALATRAVDAAFAPDGRSVVTANQDGSVHGWDVHGREAWAVKPGGDQPLHAVATTSRSPLIAVGGVGGAIHLLGPDGGGRGTLAGHEGIVLALAFSSDGEWLASDGSDTVIRLWRRQKDGGYEASRTLRAANERYRKMLPNLVRLDVQWGWGETVAFSPDGKRILSANLDGTAQLWNLDGTPHTKPFTDHGAQHVRAVAYSPRGDVVASAGFDGTVRLWKTDGAAYRPAPAVRHGNVVTSVSFSADGSRLATTGLDNRVVVSRPDGSRLLVLPRSDPPPRPPQQPQPTPSTVQSEPK